MLTRPPGLNATGPLPVTKIAKVGVWLASIRTVALDLGVDAVVRHRGAEGDDVGHQRCRRR